VQVLGRHIQRLRLWLCPGWHLFKSVGCDNIVSPQHNADKHSIKKLRGGGYENSGFRILKNVHWPIRDDFRHSGGFSCASLKTRDMLQRQFSLALSLRVFVPVGAFHCTVKENERN
jgi:hypothetical protein